MCYLDSSFFSATQRWSYPEVQAMRLSQVLWTWSRLSRDNVNVLPIIHYNKNFVKGVKWVQNVDNLNTIFTQ